MQTDVVQTMFVPFAKRLGIDPSPLDSPHDEQLRLRSVEQAGDAGDVWYVVKSPCGVTLE